MTSCLKRRNDWGAVKRVHGLALRGLAVIASTIAFLGMLPQAATAGSVSIDDTIAGTWSQRLQIAPSSFVAVPIGMWRAGDLVSVQVQTDNPLANDLTACVASEEEAQQYAPPKSPCRGKIRAATPFELRGKMSSDGPKFLILDNSYANFVTKKTTVNIAYRKAIRPEQAQALRAQLDGIRAGLAQTFEDADVDIYVKPCGMSNAFSDHRTADITICSEYIQELATQRNEGALYGTLLHEYGHSLLNKWGEPGSSEEDMADQFAAAMLLKAGDGGRAILMQWLNYWLSNDSAAEARNQLLHDDPHSLSIQRARNIQHDLIQSDELLRRWNKMLYRHMKRSALEAVVIKPGRGDDVDLAKAALQQYAGAGVRAIAGTDATTARGRSEALLQGPSCKMSLQCEGGQACRRGRCVLVQGNQTQLKQLPALESVARDGTCVGDEHCSKGLVCSPAFGRCEPQ